MIKQPWAGTTRTRKLRRARGAFYRDSNRRIAQLGGAIDESDAEELAVCGDFTNQEESGK